MREVEDLTDASLQLVERAGVVAEFTDTVATEVRSTRDLAEEQVRRMQRLLDAYQPILESLAPLSRGAASALRPVHVSGLVALLDELPHLVDRLQPALDGMGHLAPHLDEVTDRMDTVGKVVEGLPGAKVLRRRGQAREEEAAE